jgi:hypothetical protein
MAGFTLETIGLIFPPTVLSIIYIYIYIYIYYRVSSCCPTLLTFNTIAEIKVTLCKCLLHLKVIAKTISRVMKNVT